MSLLWSESILPDEAFAFKGQNECAAATRANNMSALRRRWRQAWRRFWVARSGPYGFGRLASWLAAWNTSPYHGRAFLANLNKRGFVAHSASLAHPEFHVGSNAYIGDRVVAFRSANGGRVEIEDEVHVYGDTFMQTGAGGWIQIGHGSHIQPGCYICAYVSPIEIGRRTEIAPGCAFYSYNHGMRAGDDVMHQPLLSKGAIVIGDGAWLGHRVIVLDGVRIGKGAVIGAGSVVVHDIPENAIAVGSPARVIRYRS